MHWLSSVLLAIQVISSLSIIVLVLLQQGKGADMGSSFGGGSAGSVFGASGAANFLSRTTKWFAVVFFLSTGGLAWFAHHPAGQPSVIEGGVMQGFETPQVPPSSGADVPTVPSEGQGSSVPSAPAAGATPQPAQPDASAVPSAPGGAANPAEDAGAPSPDAGDESPEAGQATPDAAAQNGDEAVQSGRGAADEAQQPSEPQAPVSGSEDAGADTAQPAEPAQNAN